MASLLCSPKFLLLFFLVSAIPLGFLVSLERSISSTHVYEYRSNGWFRECAKWDDANRRFLVSYMEGGVGQIPGPEYHASGGIVLEEQTVIKDTDLAGNASLGMVIDRPRNRLLVVNADVFGNRFGALAAYDLSTWKRLFLTHLTRPGDEKSLADDVAVDGDGNAYVTDAKSSKIWKVGVNGELVSVMRNPLFTHKQWYINLVALNGIVYHPNGFLLAIHTFSGALYKIDPKTEEVKVVKLLVGRGSLVFGDGLELLSATELVVAGNPSGRLVESRDGWETAAVVGKFSGPLHRLTTAATVKEGKVCLSHMIGFGFPNRKHVIVEATFKSLNP